jgi:hypothetical protein
LQVAHGLNLPQRGLIFDFAEVGSVLRIEHSGQYPNGAFDLTQRANRLGVHFTEPAMMARAEQTTTIEIALGITTVRFAAGIDPASLIAVLRAVRVAT